MRWSLPVITTNEGAIADIITDNFNGFIIQQHDPVALANRLGLLIKDSELRIGMGIKGRVRYEENFTLQEFEKKMNVILSNCISNTKA